ncbi:MAG: NusG domain II-containing protein [Lachnospiraceae bacterium]|nr:NusG domain II-containing protein [Lachnospiraceae bacterium]
MEKQKLKNDLVLIIVVIIVALAALLLINLYKRATTKDAYVVIEVDGEEFGRYPLTEDMEINVPTYNDGSNTVVIKNNAVSVSEASCPDKICVNHKEIMYNGETIICLPNRMTVTIVSGEDTLDGKTY